VDLPEAVGALPREVRIADHHPAPVLGDVGAEGPAVGADTHVLTLGQLHRRCLGGHPGRRGVGDRGEEGHAARQQHLLLGQAQHVVRGDRLDPRLAPAFGGDAIGARIAQEAVVPGDIARHQQVRLGPLRTGPGAQARQVDHGAHEDVGAEIVGFVGAVQDFRLGPEIARTFAPHGDELLGQQTEIVLRVGVGDAVADPLPAIRRDMRDAVSGAHDGSVQIALRLRCRSRKSRSGKRRPTDHPHIRPSPFSLLGEGYGAGPDFAIPFPQWGWG